MLFFIFYCLQISILFQMKKMDPFLLFCVFILFFFFTNFSLLYLWLFFALFIWCYLFSWRFCVLELGLRLSTIWLADFFDFSIDLSLSRLSCCICLLNASKKCFVRVFDLFIWYSNSWLFLLGWCWLCRWKDDILNTQLVHFAILWTLFWGSLLGEWKSPAVVLQLQIIVGVSLIKVVAQIVPLKLNLLK